MSGHGATRIERDDLAALAAALAGGEGRALLVAHMLWRARVGALAALPVR